MINRVTRDYACCSWMNHAKHSLLLLPLLFVGCGKPTDTPPDPTTFLMNSAVQVRDVLIEQGFECAAEGRELYPLLFDCARSEALHIYLYADDRGRLEGIRAFGPQNTSWLPIPLSLLFDPVLSDSLVQELRSQPGPSSRIILGSRLLEWESGNVPSILRISPLSAVRN